jgi:hypothetical protein
VGKEDLLLGGGEVKDKDIASAVLGFYIATVCRRQQDAPRTRLMNIGPTM